ncbi:hypothetical protein I302_107310 [Kwoniella bestiolae CBS 10118]|uniref:Uncharacterized protein n=1 Tax=Kwoniella bestiolae CBS 10118 TaxID=1296100 RepID=A0A1B9FYW2_9TREE|nr:hypothetical protein I302_06954 [Kwoniella bestiolae CBS 10118]OCF23968.1 hypothetical protein I302_06954 [Kwoniella bestiolae CBS 10118]
MYLINLLSVLPFLGMTSTVVSAEDQPVLKIQLTFFGQAAKDGDPCPDKENLASQGYEITFTKAEVDDKSEKTFDLVIYEGDNYDEQKLKTSCKIIPKKPKSDDQAVEWEFQETSPHVTGNAVNFSDGYSEFARLHCPQTSEWAVFQDDQLTEIDTVGYEHGL